jgi:hypothetical protein
MGRGGSERERAVAETGVGCPDVLQAALAVLCGICVASYRLMLRLFGLALGPANVQSAFEKTQFRTIKGRVVSLTRYLRVRKMKPLKGRCPFHDRSNDLSLPHR